MSVDSLSVLVDTLITNRLLSPDQLNTVTKELLGRIRDHRALAKELVQRGWLSVYQVNQIFQGFGRDLVLGHYRILDLLGEGGVARVYRAWHTNKRMVVALKCVRKELLSNQEAVRQFQQETKTIASLSHPNIVQTLEADCVGGTHFLAMEFVEGIDLAKLVRLSGPLPVPVACDYIRQAALGMQHAHERCLVHRDIKPANLFMVTPPGQADGPDPLKAAQVGAVIKILDWGLADMRMPAATGQQEAANTLMREETIGTADYLAPEQAVDATKVDIRADIYSLGCSFYYLLSSQPPFAGGSLLAKLLKHREVAAAVDPGEAARSPRFPVGHSKQDDGQEGGGALSYPGLRRRRPGQPVPPPGGPADHARTPAEARASIRRGRHRKELRQNPGRVTAASKSISHLVTSPERERAVTRTLARARGWSMLTIRPLLALSFLLGAVAPLAAEPLPGTQPLTVDGDLATRMVAGIDRYLMRELAASVEKRKSFWKPDYASSEAYARSVQPNRDRLKRILGVVDVRLPVKELEYVATTRTPPLVAETDRYKVHAVRWPVLDGVDAEGLLLEPKGPAIAQVVALPDADWTPEMLAGLAPGVPAESQFARRLAENGCRVLVPTLIDRSDTWSGNSRRGWMTNQPHREFVYRMAFEMGRHIIGYEIQKVLSAVDWFAREKDHPPIGVIGHGEGGLLAFYSGALIRASRPRW